MYSLTQNYKTDVVNLLHDCLKVVFHYVIITFLFDSGMFGDICLKLLVCNKFFSCSSWPKDFILREDFLVQ